MLKLPKASLPFCVVSSALVAGTVTYRTPLLVFLILSPLESLVEQVRIPLETPHLTQSPLHLPLLVAPQFRLLVFFVVLLCMLPRVLRAMHHDAHKEMIPEVVHFAPPTLRTMMEHILQA